MNEQRTTPEILQNLTFNESATAFPPVSLASKLPRAHPQPLRRADERKTHWDFNFPNTSNRPSLAEKPRNAWTFLVRHFRLDFSNSVRVSRLRWGEKIVGFVRSLAGLRASWRRITTELTLSNSPKKNEVKWENHKNQQIQKMFSNLEIRDSNLRKWESIRIRREEVETNTENA